ncbi:MAG: hypothetical protein LBK61_12030 [Spirochaetaceae bacterium]|nr:hypothetical protein [Spirochaetaceae bacterium]
MRGRLSVIHLSRREAGFGTAAVGHCFRRAPAGGENPTGFHPLVNLLQFWPKISGGQAEHPLMAAVRAMYDDPFGRAMPP